MDLGILLIGLGAVAVMVVPIILIQISNKRKAVKKMETLLSIAQQSGVNVTKYDKWGEKLIGIDMAVKKVILFNSIDDQKSLEIFDLTEYQSCNLKVDRKGGKPKDNPNLPIERIGLVLSPKGQVENKKIISFYDFSVSMSVNNELTLAEKWEKLIKENFTK